MEKMYKSFNQNKIGILIITISAIFTAFGQYFWKISDGKSLLFLFIGFTLYGLGAVTMILAFKHGSFSVIHPMMSLGYVFALLIGYRLLSEHISLGKILGTIFIFIGVVFIGVGDE
ncbi:EamA family transporter [Clostridium cellulovorans]|uniref:EamA domain-containing protein n=1 Tax=Clostridium cellulovorans (strain ATCC 35296 / DSM 3052 / OCM 3 / 743B) TaxID=573061 RepID=D9SQ65_CLOC7|nr:EamA family transporter [Clostridium cellulovorans]ADL50132.1 protein of unknown function DUF6 transmembrane [Clostridium cellulovorans 743B]